MSKYEKILDLRPTQFAMGLLEIHMKVEETKKEVRSKPKLKKFLKEHVVPIVIAPNGDKFLVDRHHFTSVCWMLGIKKVIVHIEADFSNSHMSMADFWKKMRRNKWAHLYDQFGRGPHSPIYLARDIRGLADDPYRSLAWLVRKSKGYKNTDITYAEFKWANLFRKAKLLDEYGQFNYEAATKKAIEIAKSDKARGLPGAKPPRKKKAKSKSL